MENKENKEKIKKANPDKEKKERPEPKEEREVRLIRILSKDLPGDKKIYSGLTHIKGISWVFSNAVCKKLNINKNKRIEELSKQEIEKIEEFIKHPDVPSYLKNRRRDLDTGKDRHLHGADLDLQKEFDIKKLKKIKSYKGSRHAAGLPVRGQRTKSHFRKQGKAVGVSKRGAKK